MSRVACRLGLRMGASITVCLRPPCNFVADFNGVWVGAVHNADNNIVAIYSSISDPLFPFTFSPVFSLELRVA